MGGEKEGSTSQGDSRTIGLDTLKTSIRFGLRVRPLCMTYSGGHRKSQHDQRSRAFYIEEQRMIAKMQSKDRSTFDPRRRGLTKQR